MVSPERKQARKELLRWSYLVGCKDDFTCQICGDDQEIVGIRSHHLEGFAFNKELRFDVDNGITLCVICHDLYHEAFMGGDEVPATKKTFTQFVCFLWSLALLCHRNGDRFVS